MKLTAEQINKNWEDLLLKITNYISEPRRSKLLDFYKHYEERLILMPASAKVSYHNAFPGGYIDHVNRVIDASLNIAQCWEGLGTNKNYTVEELVFSALNHDLGKMGTKDEPYYIPNPSQWHIDNKGELYTFSDKVTYMSIPDRSLYLLNQHGIEYNENEYMAIKLHDGMYDESNKRYLTVSIPEAKPRTSLVYIIHQADQLAARIEFEKEWVPKFNGEMPKVEPKKYRNTKQDNTSKAIGKSVPKELSSSLTTMLNNI